MAKRFLKSNWKKILVVLLIISGILFFVLKDKNQDILTASIEKGKISEELILSGNISATNYAKLSFESSGKIVYVGTKEGETVKRGKLLSKLDTTILNSSYQSALSTLRLYEATAQNVLDQVKNHSSDESYAQKDIRTTAEVNKDKAYESVISAKRSLDGASLFAPFSGIVTYLAHPFTGVFVTFGATEVELIDPATIYFDVLADQTEATKLSVGQKVIIILDSFEDKEFEGRVENISFVPKSGESGSTYSVKVSFVGVNLVNSKFKIAMTGDAKFVVSEKNDAFYIPTNFLKQDKTGEYIKTNSKNGKVYVKSGLQSEDTIEIIGEINEGQTVYD